MLRMAGVLIDGNDFSVSADTRGAAMVQHCISDSWDTNNEMKLLGSFFSHLSEKSNAALR